jgi:hypothetical protein
MKELSSWAEHLQEPLVLVGFIVMLFAGIIHALLKSKTLRLSKRSFERLLKRTLAYIFILSLIVIIFGLALAFKKSMQDDVTGETLTGHTPQKRVDILVATLAKKFREGNFEFNTGSLDKWNTRPVTMVLMDIEYVGGSGEGDREKLANFLPETLQSEKRINLVEREILVKLLEELNLSTSDIADRTTAMKIGRILSARIVITGSIIHDKKDKTVTLKLIDTETTQIRAVMSDETSSGELDKGTIYKLGMEVINWVRSEYPLKGIISAKDGNKCQITLGEIYGLKKGDRLDVVREFSKGDPPYVIGEVEITSTEREKSWAIILNDLSSIRKGDRVREKHGT